MALKAALRPLGIEYPKKHDVSPALMRFRDRFPAWFLVDEMADISRKLSDKREPAMYGDELSTTPADLFSRPEAEEALRYAELAHEAVKKLFAEYSA